MKDKKEIAERILRENKPYFEFQKNQRNQRRDFIRNSDDFAAVRRLRKELSKFGS